MSHRILIVRLGAIGDVVVTTTLFHGLRAAWPDAHIGWLVDARLAGMLAGLDGLGRVHQWDRVGWSGALRSGRIDRLAQGIAALRRDLRREGYTMVLDAQGLLKSSGLGVLAGAGERWALRPREGSALLAHHVVPAAERRLPGDEYRDLLRALGVPGAESARMALPIAPDRGAEARALIAQRIGEGGFVALCPFTTRPQKHWFDDRWSELTRSFLGRGLNCVIMGGPSDRERAEAIRSCSAPGTISLAGEARLEVSAAVLAHARLTIGVDTGLTHWSMAHRTPTIALMGSALPYTVALEGSTVLREPMACAPCDRRPTCAGRFECMRALTVERVMAAAVSLLERPSPT